VSPHRQIRSGVQVERITGALDLSHKFRMRREERPGTAVTFRALGDLIPPGAIHGDRVTATAAVRSDHDGRIGGKHRAYRRGADARRIDEEDHGAQSGGGR
jgi:hypothetical protein